MLTKTQIAAASATLDETDVAMLIAVVRTSEKYKQNPSYYLDIATKIEDIDGTVQAKMLNAAMTEIANLGIGIVEIDQRRVGGSDGLYYSQILQRDALLNYILGILYPEYFESIQVDENGNPIYSGSYLVGQREV